MTLSTGTALAFAIALAVLLFAASGSDRQVDATQDNAVEFTLHAGGASTAGDEKEAVNLFVGVPFQVAVSLDAVPFDYSALAVTVNYSGALEGQFENDDKAGPDVVWPHCVLEAPAPPIPGFLNAGCAIGLPPAGPSTFTGDVWTAEITCAQEGSGTLSLNHGKADTLVVSEGNAPFHEAGPDIINVSCVEEPPPPTTAPTLTPPPVPRMFKAPVLQNLFLQRQGAKIPPIRCNDSTDVATLTEQISSPIGTLNPKGEPQSLAAFEFEVRFNHSKVCVNLRPSPQFQALLDSGDAICLVRDKDTSLLEGIAQLGCVTIGKGHQDELDDLDLAIIEVRPQPELYSQMKPNQDNGQAVQILNQGCELADEQGHAVPTFSCEDADITFRYLEGDVDGPDCDVDVLDAQQVAFRWGIGKGSLQYRGFFDLEPSWPVNGDGDIDIKDVQFVFGRFGSTCDEPHPPQPPVNAKL
jgi:hypothetical protein